MSAAVTGIWKTWMTAWCWGILLFGVAFAVAAFPAADGPTRLFYDVIYWPVDGHSPWGEAPLPSPSGTGVPRSSNGRLEPRPPPTSPSRLSA